MSPARNLLVTGFPGFLGTAVVERLIQRHGAEAVVTCLVREPELELARERGARLLTRTDAPAEALNLVVGDLARYDLGCAPDERRERTTTEVFHLAGEMDLGRRSDEAELAEVDATRHLLDLAHRCPRFRRFHYLSSCFVSGRFTGLFGEDHFAAGQEFHNAFERAKYLSEVEVRARMQTGLEATIYRPTMIVGDSHDGVIFDAGGIYALIRGVLAAPKDVRVPVFGDPTAHRLHLVPRDYVAAAIDALASVPRSSGKVYHLCDSSPPTVADFLALLGRVLQKRVVPQRLPEGLGRKLVPRFGPMRRRLGVGPGFVDYLVHPAIYASRYALRDLSSARISCPRLAQYLPRLVDYLAMHPELV